MIEVLIVDDQDLMLQGLSMIVGKDQELHVAGLCHNGLEAVKACQANKVDVVLMDIRMPELNGVEATKIIKEQCLDIKIIILTTFNDDEYIFSSLKNGASGYLLKDAKPQEIVEAIKTVNLGGTLMNPDVATKVVSVINRQDTSIKTGTNPKSIKSELDDVDITSREKDICHYLALGMNNREISDELMISEGTVKNNITRILDKLNLRDRTQLALFSLRHRL